MSNTELRGTTSAPTNARRAVVTRLADIAPEQTRFVWAGRLALGRLNLLIGDPGLGKSFIALDIAARVTKGLDWPDGGKAPLGDVLVLTAEDNAADTTRPRADALGAEVARIHILSAIHTEGTDESRDTPLSLVTDLPQLEAAIVETGATVVIVDPLSAYLGITVDSYKDPHVRSVLGPLAALAERRQVAVLGVMHLSKASDKRAIYRALGSVAFVAAARLVLAVAPHPDNSEERVLLPVKSNICAPAPPLAYDVSNGTLTWNSGASPDFTADRLLASSPHESRMSRRAAVEWLQVVLADGQVEVQVLRDEAKKAGFGWRTIERAKEQLHVDSVRLGGIGAKGSWYWLLRPPGGGAKVLRLVPKTAIESDVAALDAYPTDRPSMNSAANTANFDTMAVLERLTATAGEDLAISPVAESPQIPTTGGDGPLNHDEDDIERL